MIYIKESYKDAFIRHQQELIDAGYKILDVEIVYNEFQNFKYFIKYTEA